MNCPVCKSEQLLIAERQGIEIDYCPRCRGVWLDRGELDKIVERAAREETPLPRDAVADNRPAYRQPRARSDGNDDARGGKRRSKLHWLTEIFD